MRTVVLLAGLTVFAVVSVAVRLNFRSARMPIGFIALSVLSAVNIFVFGRDLWIRQKDPLLLSAALPLILLGGALFAWAWHASRSARLKLIFDPAAPQHVLRAGPFAYIRHPFYASYVLFWLGCAVATLHPVNIGYWLVLVPALIAGALQEEKAFGQTPLATDYASYREQAGLMWPKPGSGRRGPPS